ncbi:hypothetical protein PGT21_018346 [Puccinia graminis f. sp. tritici]|uniref:PPM-type phosphatase domain-containing protein n=1 Tax=Puccinia graminis f. sp. tritici TaxID=56615 RepID=A0A5B0N4G5_PUCGR|nr:hypothetical protein PGT21_018346 [Puccinia graminis f. sp. tritici]KAA1093361.1 hypothetical protein PGTUg99_025578 [Puccinia graminis f. sp. tritici]
MLRIHPTRIRTNYHHQLTLSRTRRIQNNNHSTTTTTTTTTTTAPPSSAYEARLTQTYEIPRIGKIKVSLQSESVLGIAQSRGERPYQEDFFALASLNLDALELDKTLRRAQDYQRLIANNQAKYRKRTPNNTDQPSSSHIAQNKDHKQTLLQTLFVGVIDGHGGSDSAEYLANNLARIIEQSKLSDIPKVIRKYRSIGGYFRRFRGGFLEEIAQEVYNNNNTDPSRKGEGDDKDQPRMGVDERLSLSFLLADQQLISRCPKSGAVTTMALITPLPIEDAEQSRRIDPHFSSPLLSLVLAHLGDTSALLCSATNGKVLPLTEHHHPDSRVESDRLRRIGTGLITDSFGESRWGGSLANSRGLGDAGFKALGVTGEPDIINKIINGLDWEFLVLVSDGISNVISNQEIIDLCKRTKSPTEAAKRVVGFAESLGGRDNMTAIVVPLLGWANPQSVDLTLERREFRLKQFSSSVGSGRQNRM